MAAVEQQIMQAITDRADEQLLTLLQERVGHSLTPAEARELLADILPGVAGKFEDASAHVAALTYRDKRRAAGVDFVDFEPALAANATRGRWLSLVNYALPIDVAPSDYDWSASFSKIVGGFHRTIADANRNTTIRASIDDPVGEGWRRVGRDASTCPFCRMLIGRGQVYTEETVTFRSHDNCRCTAESVFKSKSSAEMKAWEAEAKRTNRNPNVSAWLDVESDYLASVGT